LTAHPTPLVIVARSGAASEIIGIVENPADGTESYEVCAIVGEGTLLADIAARLNVPLLDTLVETAPGAHVIFSGGNEERNAPLVASLAARGQQQATVIHADTTIGPWVTIGTGCSVSPGVRITGNVVVGANCQLHTGAILSHDDVLYDWVTLSPSVTLCGGVTIGPRTTVFAGATVMPGITIGADATVGAGALVNRDVPDGATVVGVPDQSRARSG